jgi:hypothetical protein
MAKLLRDQYSRMPDYMKFEDLYALAYTQSLSKALGDCEFGENLAIEEVKNGAPSREDALMRLAQEQGDQSRGHFRQAWAAGAAKGFDAAVARLGKKPWWKVW